MKPEIVLILSSATILALASARNGPGKDFAPSFEYGMSGYGLELIFTRLDYIKSKLLEVQKELRDLRQKDSQNKDITNPLAINTAHTPATSVITPTQPAKNVESSLLCRDVSSQSSGVYEISINNGTESFPAFCEQSAHGGGWLVVQHRFDGSVDFDRNWDAYRKGFGSPEGEYWIGLDRLHQLTSTRKQELLIEMKSFSGKYGQAYYNEFEIGNEKEEFYLKTVEGYNGTAGDGMLHHKGYMFSTLDHNNNANTAPDYTTTSHGGWWYGTGWTHLNGPYVNSESLNSMFWYMLNGYKSNGIFYYPALSYSRMMIRPAL